MIAKGKLTYCANDPLPIGEIFHGNDLELLTEILVDLVNISSVEHTLPDWKKKAIVKPILKGSLDPQCLSSFRPLSNLTFLSRVLENVILEQLSEPLKLVEAFPENQSVYRRLFH